MIDYKEFISNSKSLLIAPAGYGKTHSISECLKHTTGKQLILTHTHAGIISIKEKLKKSCIPTSNYNVETITSFAQKYAFAFTSKSENIPSQDNTKEYYPFIISRATEILQYKSVSLVIKSTYSGLFVDEYQDCTLNQHNLILALSKILDTRIIGDPLQGIFNFKGGNLVDMKDKDNMKDFLKNEYQLTTPQRWRNNNENLGIQLKTIRTLIERREEVDLSLFNEINLVKYNGIIYHEDNKNIRDQIYKLLSNRNLLI